MKIAIRHAALLLFIYLASVMGTASPAAENASPSFVGTWQGTLSAGAISLRVVFNIKADDNGVLSGTLDSPDQNTFGLPIDTVRKEGGDVTAEIKRIQGSYSGKFADDGKSIIGTWSQLGQSLPLTLTPR
jgi:hypothetical protein